jgi:hypothetical protein
LLVSTLGLRTFLAKGQKYGRLAARTVAFLILEFCCVSAAPRICFTQVQLPTVNLGDTNFEDAFGGPGWLLEEFPEARKATNAQLSVIQSTCPRTRCPIINRDHIKQPCECGHGKSHHHTRLVEEKLRSPCKYPGCKCRDYKLKKI